MTGAGTRPAVLDRLGPLGLGAATFGNLFAPVGDDDCAEIVDAALAAGVGYFDTAPHYGLGLSEERLGAALGQRRRSVVLSTKVGRLLDDGFPPAPDGAGFVLTSTRRRRWDFSDSGVERSLADSLERLGTDRVDIALVHDPDDHVDEALTEALPALCRLRDAGMIDAVGVGVNRADLALRLMTGADLDVVLVAGRYTLLDQRAGNELLPECARRGIAVIAAAPFNSGLLARPDPSGGGRFDYVAAPPELVARAGEIADVCAEHGVELPEAALRFPLRHRAVVSVLASARTADEVRQNTGRVAAAVGRGDDAWEQLWADLEGRRLIAEHGDV